MDRRTREPVFYNRKSRTLVVQWLAMPDCFELEPERFPTVIPLYRAAQICFPLIFAVLEQRQRGQVFVDNPNYPESALVVTDFGFMNYIGGKRGKYFFRGPPPPCGRGRGLGPPPL